MISTNLFQTLQLSPDFLKYDISKNYYNFCEMYQILNNSKSNLTKEMVQKIFHDLVWNLTFTNLISDVYSNAIFMILLLDTHEVRKYENIRRKTIKFLRKYLINFDDPEFNKIIRKHYNIFYEKIEINNYLLNRKKNIQLLYRIFFKFLLARCFFKKLYFKVLEKRYAPNGPGYFEAKLSFNILQ